MTWDRFLISDARDGYFVAQNKRKELELGFVEEFQIREHHDNGHVLFYVKHAQLWNRPALPKRNFS